MSVLTADHAVHADDPRAVRMAAVRAGEVGSVHSWDTTTDEDGPGLRLVLRLAGCPLRCQYCYGPDAWLMRDGVLHTIDTVMARILREASSLKAAGGGITLSGGEPLLQPAFVAQVLRAAREEGLHTALDTSGYLGRRLTDDMIGDLDLAIVDLKSGLSATYREVTGRDMAPTLELGRRLGDRGVPVWARFVVVPGLTDEWHNVEAVADHLAQWPSVARVDVVPFDQRGQGTWHALGREYKLEMTGPPDLELLERVRGQFSSRGLTVA